MLNFELLNTIIPNIFVLHLRQGSLVFGWKVVVYYVIKIKLGRRVAPLSFSIQFG